RAMPNDSENAARPPLPFTLQGSVVLGVLAVVLIGAIWLLIAFEALPEAFYAAAPVAAGVFGALWFLVALLRRHSRSILFAAAWLGASLSLLLAAQGIAEVGDTLIGLVLIAVGVALILRGLLMANVALN
ncbi:MAG: hypothetical protein ACK4P1_10830, partial [Aggregatilineales bacterium]